MGAISKMTNTPQNHTGWVSLVNKVLYSEPSMKNNAVMVMPENRTLLMMPPMSFRIPFFFIFWIISSVRTF